MAFSTLQDVITLLSKPGRDGFSDFDKLTISPILQFGTDDQPYLLQTLLPEQLKPKNQYTEGAIEYISSLAKAGSSYSPTDINKGGNRVAMFDVKVGFTNQKDVLDVASYEAIHDILQLSGDSANSPGLQEAAERLLNWTENNITKPMMDLNEVYRSQAILDGRVRRRGANGYSEDVIYPTAPGQRIDVPGGTVGAPAGWNNTSGYDVVADVLNIQTAARQKGLEIVRMISNYDVKMKFMRNDVVRSHFFGVTLRPTQQNDGIAVGSLPAIIDEDAVDVLLRGYRLPRWETYDKTYNQRNPTTGLLEQKRYFDRVNPTNGKEYDPILFVCRTNRNIVVSLPNPIGQVNLTNVLGYYAIGRCVGHSAPGRIMNRLLEDSLHPPSFTCELIQEGLPVLQSPESFFVLNVYRPSAT
ncbi:major capsid protein [Brasilonema sp. CT11]|nr:major capsid protein [Brasilonema sp. CT11]